MEVAITAVRIPSPLPSSDKCEVRERGHWLAETSAGWASGTASLASLTYGIMVLRSTPYSHLGSSLKATKLEAPHQEIQIQRSLGWALGNLFFP